MEVTLQHRQQLEMLAAFLRDENTLALATVDEQGEASVAPLFYIVDEQLAIFWLSSPSSLHSRNLERTPRAAATVYRHTASWKDIRGVQMRGFVRTVTEPSRRAALVKIYRERFQLGAIFLPAISQCGLYEFRPGFFRYIDNSVGFGYKFELTPTTSNAACPHNFSTI